MLEKPEISTAQEFMQWTIFLWPMGNNYRFGKIYFLVTFIRQICKIKVKKQVINYFLTRSVVLSHFGSTAHPHWPRMYLGTVKQIKKTNSEAPLQAKLLIAKVVSIFWRHPRVPGTPVDYHGVRSYCLTKHLCLRK